MMESANRRPPTANRQPHTDVVLAAARAMTAADATDGFQTRVLAGLEARPSRAWRLALLPAAAGAATVMFALAPAWLARQPLPAVDDPPRAMLLPASSDVAAVLAVTMPPPAPQVPSVATGEDAGPSSDAVPAALEPTAAELAWQARAVPKLADLPALVVAPIQPEPSKVPLLERQSLMPERLHIAPLPRSWGNR